MKFFGQAKDHPSNPTPEEEAAGAAMDPAERVATLIDRCQSWPTYRANQELREALVALAVDYKRLRDRVSALDDPLRREAGR